MSRDGVGNYSLPVAPFVNGEVISADDVNSNFADMAAALTESISKDGQTVPTSSLPMGGMRHTGVGNATARNNYAAAGQVQDGAFLWCGTAGGTADALTLSPSPAISAYAAGQVFRFIAASSNTGTATVAVSGRAAKAIQDSGSALSAGKIVSGKIYELLYDGTSFQARSVSLSTLGGNLSLALNEAKGADVASASTTDIWTAGDGNTIHVTGATTITSLGTAPQAGAVRRIIFDASLTLTNGSNLVLPGGANIVTGAGDICEVIADTTTRMCVTAYTAAASSDARALIGARALDVTQNSQSGSYTLALTDRGKGVDTSAEVVVPPNSSVAFPVGSEIYITNTSASAINITQGSGVTLRRSGSATTGTYSLAAYGFAILRKIATDTWMLAPVTSGYAAPDYTSAQSTIPATNSTNTFAHGLGVVPARACAKLVNVTAENGFTVGEVVFLGSHVASNNNGLIISSDATNVTVKSAATLFLINKSTHASFAPTSANWKIVVEAWKG